MRSPERPGSSLCYISEDSQCWRDMIYEKYLTLEKSKEGSPPMSNATSRKAKGNTSMLSS